jgi:hypothetical protein
MRNQRTCPMTLLNSGSSTALATVWEETGTPRDSDCFLLLLLQSRKKLLHDNTDSLKCTGNQNTSFDTAFQVVTCRFLDAADLQLLLSLEHHLLHQRPDARQRSRQEMGLPTWEHGQEMCFFGSSYCNKDEVLCTTCRIVKRASAEEKLGRLFVVCTS